MVLVLKSGATPNEIQKISKKIQTKTGVNTKKYCGIIKLKESPLAIQKKMRSEWQ